MRIQIVAAPLAVLGLAVTMGVAGPAQSAAATAPPAATVAQTVPMLDHSPTVDALGGRAAVAETGHLEIGGHRGGVDRAPENTLAAVRTAIAAGADSVELDVRFTSDGRPVILHDTTLERTTNCSGLVADWSLQALTQCDAGAWFSQAFTAERVPMLTEVLDELKPTDLMLYVHVKLLATVAQAETLVSAVADRGMADEQVVFVADEPERLELLSLVGVPRERLAWVVHAIGDFGYWQSRWGGLIVRGPRVTKALVDQAHARGQRVGAIEGFPVTRPQAEDLGLDTFLADNLEAALAYER